MISYALLMLLLIVADRTLKVLMTIWLADGPIVAIEGVFRFRYIENTGAAFGMFSSSTLALSIATAVVLLVLIYVIFFAKPLSRFTRISLAIIVAGGLGNLYDRIVYGFVVDFIEPLFIDFAIFNFADICINVGCVLLLLSVILDKGFFASKKKTENADT